MQRILFSSICISLITISTMAQRMNPGGQKPPVATKVPHTLTQHGHQRQDPYYWMNQRENSEVIQHLEAENAYRKAVMKPLESLQNTLFEEMKGRIKEDDASLPYRDGAYWYYTRFVPGGEYPLYCRKKGNLEATEEVLLDGNELAKGYDYFQIGGWELSDNDQILAYGVDTVSRRNYTVRFKNLVTGELYPESIPNTEAGSYAFATDNQTFFYIRRDEQTLLGYQVYRHTLGTDVSKDILVYEEKDAQFALGLYRMKSKKYIAVVSVHNGVSTEYRMLNAAQPMAPFQVFLPREKDHEYYVVHDGKDFLVMSNAKGARNYQILQAPDQFPTQVAAWKTLLAHRPDVLLEGLEVFQDHLVVTERKNGLTQLRVRNRKTQADHLVDFGEPVYEAYIGTNPEFETSTLRFTYTSLTTPSSTFDYDMNTKTKVLKREQPVLGGFDKSNYQTERLWVTARDGVKIPVSIVYRKDTPRDGSAPLLQYAYGSYGYSMDVSFTSTLLSLLDRGFVYAICHIRGGQEMGRAWYDDGKMMKKKNTFNDFIDCSKALVSQKYAHPNKLFAMGGSAGGLLMGAVMNEAPHLYQGVVAQVPFVDVVTTMLDETIPLTTGEWEEWGNPKNKEAYEYMLSYSPYDQVKAKDYPHVLVTAGLHDSQVQYWEPAKWVAKLRELKTDQNILLFHCDMSAGHGGASGRFASLRETAMEYAFLLDLAGIVKE